MKPYLSHKEGYGLLIYSIINNAIFVNFIQKIGK